MSVEIGCVCGGLPAHSHVGRWVDDGSRYGARRSHYEDSAEVRIWVDWKAVARELARDGGFSSAVRQAS